MSDTTTTASGLEALAAGVWTVDASHSNVGFVVRHLMVAKVRGQFTDFSGTITVGENPLESTVRATVQAASITTNDEGRDAHLKTADFFEVDRFPTLDLVSTGLERRGADFVLHADLSIHGVTLPVDFDLEFEGVVQDPWGNTKAGFTAQTEISRKAFGLEWNAALETGGVVVGDKVKIVLEIEALKG